jgi:hypothetical protein
VDTSNSNKEYRIDQSVGQFRIIESGVAERLILSSGNLGLGVTPSAWVGNGGWMDLPGNGFLGNATSYSGNTMSIGVNAYYGSGAWRYKATGLQASFQSQTSGQHQWFTAPSGTAGNAITFTQAMTLNASGNLGIGATSPSDKLQIVTPLATTGTGIVSPNGITLQNTNSTAGNYTTIQNRDSSGSQNAQIQFINVTHGSPFQGAIAFTTRVSTGDFVERARIHSNGVLTLGQTTADDGWRLQMNGGLRANFDRFTFSEIYGGFGHNGDSGGLEISNINSSVDRAIRFSNGTSTAGRTETARISSEGYLLVGTTTYGGVGGLSIAPQGSGGAGTAAASVVWNRNTTTNSSSALIFQNAGTPVGSVTYTSTATAYNTSSDYRLKENVQPMQDALAKIAQLNPVTYTWKADGSDGQGFIAHELQTVVPDCVTGEKDAVDEDGNPKYQGVDTSFLVATLVKAVQELTAKIASLEAQLNP